MGLSQKQKGARGERLWAAERQKAGFPNVYYGVGDCPPLGGQSENNTPGGVHHTGSFLPKKRPD